MNEKLIQELIKRLEIRKQQLEDQLIGTRESYRIHEMHHLRDIVTVLAVLKNELDAEKLVENMPTKEDL